MMSDDSLTQGESPERLRRLFFALDPPAALTRKIENLVQKFDAPPNFVRWVRAGNMHITLKFLGEVDEASIPSIVEAARRAVTPFPAMKLIIEGLGVFPNHEQPQVVWFGLKGDTETLRKMESALSSSLAPLGFPPEDRPFAGHLTIGRVKSGNARGKIARLVRQYHRFYIGEAVSGEVVLYESRLSMEGAVYTKLDSFPLTGENA
jgi:2'-5' RNA ligase